MPTNKNGAGVSRIALTMALVCGLAGGTGHAFAQDASQTAATTDSTAGTEVVVVGSRKALKSAQDIKKSADTVVDSITATDIGSFPDKSVADALQRVPGVSVIRTVTEGGEDSMHYPAEPSGVLIRGLPQVSSEFNGREIFSAGSASGLSWEDISPEMLARVDTYKNSTAEMLEGGIGGTVDLTTRLPFDQKGQVFQANVEGSYGDLSQKWEPSASMLYSTRFNSDIGKLGFLVDVAYSKVETESQSVTNQRYVPFAPGVIEGAPANETVFIPAQEEFGQTVYDRTRRGLGLAAQWESNDDRFLATAQYTKSAYQNTWTENQVVTQEYWPSNTAIYDESYVEQNSGQWGLPIPANTAGTGYDGQGINPGAPWTFASDGMFQSGVIGSGVSTWGRGAVGNWGSVATYDPTSTESLGNFGLYGINQAGSSNPLPLYNPCLDNSSTNGGVACSYGVPVSVESRYSIENRTVEDGSVNLKWTPTDRLRFVFDAQHVRSSTTHYDVTYNSETYANVGLNLTSGLPQINFQNPSNMNVLGNNNVVNGANFLANYRNYYNASLMDHLEDSRASLDAARFDVSYSFNNPWLTEFDAGVRVSNRNELIDLSAYNFGELFNTAADNWAGPANAYHLDSPANGTFAGYGSTPYWNTINFGTTGLLNGLLNTNQFVTMNTSNLKNIAWLEQIFGMKGQSANGYSPVSAWDSICNRTGDMQDSCFMPGEVTSIKLIQDAIYGMLRFGGPDAVIANGVTLSGNVGLRVVRTDLTSAGAVNYPTSASIGTTCTPLTAAQISQLSAGAYPVSVSCLIANSANDQAFSNGGYGESTVKTEHTYSLPSLNLKFSLPDGYIIRVSASKGMYMPDVGLMKNYTTLTAVAPQQSDIVPGNSNLVFANGSSSNPTSVNLTYEGSTGNPRLKATTADQFDLTLERYFAAVGSFGIDLFSKKFYNYVQSGIFNVPYTNNGVTRAVQR